MTEHKNFTADEVKSIYNQIKLPPTYFKKYETLPPSPVHPHGRWPVPYDFPRAWIILDFNEWTQKYNLKTPEHLGIPYDDPEIKLLKPKKITKLPYPPYDLHDVSTLYKGEQFDFFILNQTLEHLHNPHVAVREICKLIKSGGHIFASVPTLNIPHGTPIHFSGLYPITLALLFIENDCEILEMGQFGSFTYIEKLFRTHSWPSHKDLVKNGKVVNEERNVCQCWILAKKK